MVKTAEQIALQLDRDDPLGHIRERFYLNPGEIYMDGNSLGLLSKDAEKSLLRVVEEWKALGIGGWMNAEIPWFNYARELAKLQAPLLGADEDEIILHASTTVNIHALIATFFHPHESKNKILMDGLTFPSDRYAVESQLILKGFDPKTHLVVVKSHDGRTIEETDVINAMTDDIAVCFLPSVLYRSGQLLDMETLTEAAHQRDIFIGFDCAHSVGCVPHYFTKWTVDFACWCNYKYCNNGPGGVAGLYINRQHFDKGPGMAGWFGYKRERQFDLHNTFEPALNAGGWQIGSPHILSLAPLEGSLKIFQEVGIENVRKKSLEMTDYAISLIEKELTPFGFEIGTPLEKHRRGGHVALEHEEAVRINEAMKSKGVLPDFRFPNVIRLAPIALYTSFHEIYQAIQIIREIMETNAYERYEKQRGLVA